MICDEDNDIDHPDHHTLSCTVNTWIDFALLISITHIQKSKQFHAKKCSCCRYDMSFQIQILAFFHQTKIFNRYMIQSYNFLFAL